MFTAFDEDGYGYAFTTREALLAWLEPETVAALVAVFDPGAQILRLDQDASGGWTLEDSGAVDHGRLADFTSRHEERFGRLRPQ